MALLVKAEWLVEQGIYPSRPAVYVGIMRGELPEEAIVRIGKGRKLRFRPDVIQRWIEAGVPKPERVDLRKRRGRGDAR